MATRFLAGALLALGLTATGAQAQTFSFGLWGDMPYQKAGDAPKIPALLDSINQSDIAFSIYDGDIKDGSSPCTDGIYASALTMFGQLKQPVVYVPATTNGPTATAKTTAATTRWSGWPTCAKSCSPPPPAWASARCR